MTMHGRWIAVAMLALAGCGDAADETDAPAQQTDSGDAQACLDDDVDGYTTCAGDCDDADDRAHPGASAQTTPRAGGSFDFDCDGKEEPTGIVLPAVCATNGTDCGCYAQPEGWAAVPIPPVCGETGAWKLTCTSDGAVKCKCFYTARIVACQ